MAAIEILRNILTEDSVFSYKPLNGLTNEVYLISVEKLGSNVDPKFNLKEDLNHNPSLNFIFRVYGAASVFINREMEIAVLLKLGQKGLCPKIYYGEEKFRLEEFMEYYSNSTNDFILSNIGAIFQSILNLNLLDLIDYYHEDGVLKMKHRNCAGIVEISDNQTLKVPADYLKPYLINLAGPAIENMKAIREKLINDQVSLDKLDNILPLMNNFEKVINELFNDRGVLALTHHDLHKLNIMKNQSETHFIFLDFEFVKVSPLGLDAVNFLIELSFDYSTSPFKFAGFDIKANFEKYQQFISLFPKSPEDEYLGELPYYLNLIRLACVFWIIIEAYYVQVSYTSFNYLDYISERLSIFKETYEI